MIGVDKLLGLVTLFLFLVQNVTGYFISIDAKSSECFYERLRVGSKLTLMFEVVEGGFLDIDVKITGPDNKQVYNGERESSGRYTFSAHVDGLYKYCFSNEMSSMTPKIIMFRADAEEKLTHAGQDDTTDNHNKLEDMIQELSQAMTTVKHQQEVMEVRARVHREINANTNNRVVMWSFFEAFVLVCMTVGQVYYLKRFFEVRRVI